MVGNSSSPASKASPINLSAFDCHSRSSLGAGSRSMYSIGSDFSYFSRIARQCSHWTGSTCLTDDPELMAAKASTASVELRRSSVSQSRATSFFHLRPLHPFSYWARFLNTVAARVDKKLSDKPRALGALIGCAHRIAIPILGAQRR